MAYNPYNDVKNIVNQKGTYNERRYGAAKGNYQQVADNAVQYYNNLTQSGQNGVADELKNASYEKALEILNRYKPDAAGATPVTDGIGEKASSYLNSIQNQIQPSKSTTDALGTANGAVGSYMNQLISGVNNTNAQSGKYQNELYKYMGDQSARYDNLNNYNLNANPYTSDIGKSIMQNYQLQGYNASQNAAANVAGDNGGNIDSYAAANANRQQLAFTNAGNEAVRNDFNSRVANSLSILQSLGVDVGDAFDKIQTNIDSGVTQNKNLMDSANTMAQTAVNGSAASDEIRTNAATSLLSNLTSLAQQEVQAAVTRDGYVSDQTLSNIDAQLQTQLKQMGIDADTAAAASEYALQQLKNEGALAEADIKGQYDLAGTQYKANSDLAGTQYKANADLSGAQYKANSDYATSSDKIANDQIKFWAEKNTRKTDSTNPTYNWIGETFEELLNSASPLLGESAKITAVQNEMLNDSTLSAFAPLIKAYVSKHIAKGNYTASSSVSSSNAAQNSATNSKNPFFSVNN